MNWEVYKIWNRYDWVSLLALAFVGLLFLVALFCPRYPNKNKKVAQVPIRMGRFEKGLYIVTMRCFHAYIIIAGPVGVLCAMVNFNLVWLSINNTYFPTLLSWVDAHPSIISYYLPLASLIGSVLIVVSADYWLYILLLKYPRFADRFWKNVTRHMSNTETAVSH